MHFLGARHLVGMLPVADVLALSAVEGLRVLAGGTDVDPDALLVTRNHVRPSYEAGRLVLVVARRPRALVPFEVPDCTPCCADHG